MSQKTTVATVGIVIFLLLLSIGSAYAGYTLTSETEIDNNSMDVDHITLTSTQYTDLLGDVAFNTVNTNGTITYTLQTTGNLTWGEHNNVAVADITGTARTISVAKTASVNATDYGLAITVNAFTPVSGVTYVMSVGNESVGYEYAEYSDNAWTFSGLSFDSNLAIKMYIYAPSALSTMNPSLGFTNGTSVFSFTATAIET